MFRKINRGLIFVTYCFLIGALPGCAFISPTVRKGPAVSLEAYSGRKARVEVGNFAVMASKAHPGIGAGLKEMFLAVSSSSNHFEILNQGNPQEANPSPDLIINVAVTDFEPQASGGSAGTGGGGGVNSGVLGGLLGAALNKAHIALDIRVTDAATAQIVAQGRVQGQATDISGAVMAGSFSGWALGSNLFAYANTPMEKAIRICIFEAVRYITRSIPEKYYKY